MKEPNRHSDTFQEHEEFEFDIQACASMDCTGLIPALPVSEAELDSYKDLYPYLPTAKKDSSK